MKTKKLALDVLRGCLDHPDAAEAITALEADIAQAGKPVAWLDGDCIITFGNMKYGFIDRRDRAIPDSWKPLYPTPPEPAVNAEMLDALKEIAGGTYDSWSEGYRAQQIAVAAIAKATS